MTRGEQVRAAIQERFGLCAVLPAGSQVALATEFGVSRQRVGQIVAALGKSGTTTLPSKVCASGGAVMNRQSPEVICRDCKWIDIACSWCEKPVRRLASRFVSQIGRTNSVSGDHPATYSGQAFCDRTCFGRWAGSRNKGKSRLIQHGTSYARYRRNCRCEICVAGAKASQRHAYLRSRERAEARPSTEEREPNGSYDDD